MVDPYQVIIDNGTCSEIENTDNFTATLTQNMNESSKQLQQQQQNELETQSVISETVNWNEVNEYQVNDCFSEIMCGPLTQHGTTTTTEQQQQQQQNQLSENHLQQNGDLITYQRDIDSVNLNQVCVIVNKVNESNDSTGKLSRSIETAAPATATTTTTAATNTADSQDLAKSQATTTSTYQSNQIAIMDSRKVEPLRININREPIKTKIKLGGQNAMTLSPKSSSSAVDESDDGADIDAEPTHYPRITIKPIVKPASESHHHNHHHHHHNSHGGSATAAATQEAIPKLKISGNHQNYQLLHAEPTTNTVPKFTTQRGGSTSNLSIGSISSDTEQMNTEVVPKLTIKLDNHTNDSTKKEVSLVSNDGVKVTLKPIAEPPLPKFTIKTNAFNDTAKVIMVNNTLMASSEQTDESSDEQPSSQPPSCQPSPNDKTHAISSTSLTYGMVGNSSQTAEDNLSTCSSGSSSSYSSSSSTTTPNNDIKLIIKATSTGSCVVSPNTASVIRNSPSSSSSATTTSSSSSMKNCSKSSSKTNSDQSKLNSLASSVVTSSTSSSTSMDAIIPKLNIKLSHNDYPQVIHNNDDTKSTELNNRTGSPLLTKFTIRKSGTGDENIIIPKVTIKPVIKPNENADAPLVTPKIILKPIPKPIDKPLEINIATGPGSPFRTEPESQQSPRIILKINKNTTSQANDALTSTTIITEEPASTVVRIDSPSVNDLKRSNYENDFQAKKPKIDAEIVLSSSDSDLDETDRAEMANNNHDSVLEANVIKNTIDPVPSPAIIPSFDSNSGLRSILSRPQMKIQPQPLQTFLKSLPPFKTVATGSDNNKTNDVIDLCHDSNDQLISEQPPSEQSVSANQTKQHQQQSPSDMETAEQKKDSGFNWQYFYSENEKEAPKQEPSHPIVRQNIERTNVLAALMEAERNKEKSTTNGNNNNSSAKDALDRRLNATNKGNSLLLENDGSSSDCIVIEDTGSEPFPAIEYGGSAENTSDQNGPKKESVDRDSGVDVSNSVKSTSEDGTTPVTKRPRGRPRKDKGATTPKSSTKKQFAAELSKRKFAGVLMSQHNAQAEVISSENSMSEIPTIENSVEETTDLTTTESIIITSSTAPSIPPNVLESDENEIIISPVVTATSQDDDDDDDDTPAELDPLTPSISVPIISTVADSSNVMDVSLSIDTEMEIPSAVTPTTTLSNLIIDGDSPSASTTGCTTPTSALTPTALKERKRRIVVDDDDESPTFNPLSRSTKKMRGKNRRKGSLLKQKQRKMQLLIATPDKANESAIFTSPESIDRRKLLVKDAGTPALQVFEEDTRMSSDSLFTSPSIRTTEFLQNEESQSSLHSSTSATVESSVKKFRSKIEVVDPEGRTEFTVDLIAEYDWPPPKGCCPSRNRDTYMIQEQIAEYLGVKSFKRKYPDLPRRMVEMEERNYLLEKGLVSEKMCDLGLTAVTASDVLDIMHSDFYEKFEEYRRFLREKQVRDFAARQKQLQAGILGKSLSARENAMRNASMWNADFNRSRMESRRECFDLQNLVVQLPEKHRTKQNRPVTKQSNYPVALVPGQFQEYYRTYSAAELLCYPLNTVLADPYELDRKLREYYQEVRKARYISDDDSDSSGSSDSDSDSDSSDSSDDSSSSSEDEKPLAQIEVKPEDKVAEVKSEEEQIPKLTKSERNKCHICGGLERCNQHNKPEIFIGCTKCQRNAHPTCLKMSSRTVRRVNEYAWHCKDCRTCIKCRKNDNDDKMMLCDQCDRSYHIYCIGLRKVPPGKWHCAVCTVCTTCGARRPEGHNNPNLTQQQKQKLIAVAKWTHEYGENPLTKEQEHVAMLCTSCVQAKQRNAC